MGKGLRMQNTIGAMHWFHTPAKLHHHRPFLLTDIGVFGGGEAPVRALGTAQPKLQQVYVLPSDHTIPGGVRGH